MKRVLLVAFCLLLLCSVPASAQKMKVKNKDKRFETVVKESVTDYAGRYQGFEAGYYIEVSSDAAGNLTATSFEGSRRARLENIKLEQGRLTATKVYEDGTTQAFSATFVNRWLNGVSAFGLLVEAPLTVDSNTTLSRVFYKRD